MGVSVTELLGRIGLAIWNKYTILDLTFESWLFAFILRPIAVSEQVSPIQMGLVYRANTPWIIKFGFCSQWLCSVNFTTGAP